MVVTIDLVNKYAKWYLSQGHSYVSTQEYYNNIKRFVKDGIEINQKTVDAFRKNAMRTTTSGALKSFFRYLVRHHNYPDEILNIRFDRNKPIKRYPKSISVKEVEILISNMPTLRKKIFTIVLFELGLRISEGLKIKWEDFNWIEWMENKNGYGKVSIKDTKRGNFRAIPVKPQLMNLLYKVCNKKTEQGIPIGTVVFDFGIESYIRNKENTNQRNLYLYIHNQSGLYRVLLNKISKEKLNKRISPHQLRHSKAQMLMDKGMNLDTLKLFLGHKDITSTEIYAQASPTKLRKELQQIDAS